MFSCRDDSSKKTVILLRHAARGLLVGPDFGRDTPITHEGRHQAELLLAQLDIRPRYIWYAPVLRCRQTAVAMATSVPAHSFGPVTCSVHRDLAVRPLAGGGSGAPRAAIRSLLRPPTSAAAPAIWARMQALLRDCPAGATALAVTHDLVLASIVHQQSGAAMSRANWPNFLEPLFVEARRDAWEIRYRSSSWRVVCET